ncbi:hypothetical protein BY458DRAFT_497376 [Sporodiniella umbellata]|nr:hypothetical protein BY458DRAFT_497376 [Sporodiniella umbellata]
MHLIQRHMRETIGIPDAWLSPTCPVNCANPKLFLESQETLKLFLEILSSSFLELFRIHGHNRARQRRRLKKMMYEWEMIQHQAIKIDQLFQQTLGGPIYFTQWTLRIKQEMMEDVLTLGFELDLYSPHEYRMILWYYSCLLQDHFRLLQDIRSHSTSGYLESQMCWTLAKSLLVKSTYEMIRWVEFTGQWKPYRPLMDDEKTRYWQRLKCFARVSPLPPYEAYLRDNQRQLNDIDSLCRHLAKAQALFVKLYQRSNEEQKAELCSEYSRQVNSIGIVYVSDACCRTLKR